MTCCTYLYPSMPYNTEMFDLFNSTHLLIAGTTGSGKSNLLDNLLINALINYSPTACQFVFCDPKKIELQDYKDLPHCCYYMDENKDIARVLKWATEEMDARYKYMQKNGNNAFKDNRLYIVIDELADLMISPFRRDVLLSLQRLLQLGRACNIHAICCTQAPSRRIIPAELTLNFTDRVALRCISPIESKQIIMVKGAENLQKYGKGLYRSCDGLKEIDIGLADKKLLEKLKYHWKNKALLSKFETVG